MDESQRKLLFSTPNLIVYPRKFDTAIRKSTISSFISRYNLNTLTSDDQLITNAWSGLDISDFIFDTTFYPELYRCLLQKSETDGIIFPHLKHNEYSRMYEATELVIMSQVKYMNSLSGLGHESEIERKLKQKLKNCEFTPFILNLITLIKKMDFIVSKSNQMYDPNLRSMTQQEKDEFLRKNTYAHIPELELMFQWSHKLLMISSPFGHWILPRPYLLLIHNKLCDLVSILLLSQFSSGIQYPHTFYSTVVRFIDTLAELFVNYGKSTYTILKVLESYCVAESLLELDEWRNDEFLNAVHKEIYHELGFNYKSSSLRTIIRSVSTPVRHELACLSKILGHPLVDMEEGARSLFQKTHEVYTLSPFRITESECYIKENYIRNHIAKHKRWPPCRITSPNCHAALREAWIKGIDPYHPRINKAHGPFLITEYVHIELLPNLRFEKLEHYIPYLKDKTISLLREPTFMKYIDHTHNQVGGWKDTRLLLYYLLSSKDDLNHVKLLDSYCKANDLEEFIDYLVIRVVPKEKELKEVFRGFGCQTYMDRARRLAQEKNAMHYLDLYCDEQAMTLSDLALLKKLYAFRSLTKAYKDHVVLYINLDASSWNNHFRHETVDKVMGSTLDAIFNVKCYSKTQQAFEKTLVIIPDDEVCYYWEGQDGGIEGLNQDTWVVTYIGQIKTALARFGLKYHVLCKGDDFRIALLIPPQLSHPDNVKTTKNEVVSHISVIAKELGHKIKIEESYGSSLYFTFSKAASVGTIELPQTLRKIQKTHGANNAFIMTLDDYIASTFSNAHSTCKVGTTTLGPYYVAVTWSLLYLHNSNYYSRCSPLELAACLLVPNVLGGFPIIYLHNMSVRAESDLLSPFLGLLDSIKQWNNQLYAILKRFVLVPANRKEAFTILLADPYGLPNDRPTLPSSLLRMSISPVIRAISKNEDVIKLYEAAEASDMKKIIECLKSTTVYNPKVIANIYAATPAGLWKQLLTQFESSRSVYELLILKGGTRRANRILWRVLRAEDRLQNWRRDRLVGVPSSSMLTKPSLYDPCPAKYAQSLREYCYMRPVEGITMPPLQHQLSFVLPLDGVASEWDRRNHFSYYTYPVTEILPKTASYHWATSNQHPFLGYSTRRSTTEPQLHFVEKDVILSQIKNMLDLMSWVSIECVNDIGEHISSNYSSLIREILKYYTKEPVERFDPFVATRKSGTRQHHMRSPSFREAIVPNVLSNMYQQISGESNSHITFRNTNTNFAVNFLHVLCYSIHHIFGQLEVGPIWNVPQEIWAVTTNCQFCSNPIADSPLVCDLTKLSGIKPILIMSAGIGKLAKKILNDSLAEFDNREWLANHPLREVGFEDACLGVMQEFVDQCYTSRVIIEGRYTQHPLTQEGHHILTHLLPTTSGRTVGVTELRAIPIHIMCQCIQQLLFFILPTILTDLTPNTIWMKLSQLPYQELPWYGLMSGIYKAGKLPDVIRWFSKKTKCSPGPIYYNPAAASHYIGGASYISQCLDPIFPKIIFLSYYSEGGFDFHLRRTLYCMLWHIVVKDFSYYIRSSHLMTHEEKQNGAMELLTAQALMISMIDVEDQEYLGDTQELIRLMMRGPITLLDIVDEDWDHYDTYEEFEEAQTKICKLLMHVNSRCNWVDVFDYIKENFDEVKRACEDYLLRHQVLCIVTDLASCILTVRHQGHDELENIDEDDLPLRRQDGDMRHGLPVIRETIWQNPYAHIVHQEGILQEFHDLPVYRRPSRRKTTLGVYHLYRQFGQSGASVNSLLFILSSVHFRPDNQRELNILCLADGFGGFATGFLATWPNATVIFNTKKLYRDTECIPHEVINTFPSSIKDKIIYNHLDEGYDDLNHSWTRDYYINLPYYYDIITSELELPFPSHCEYINIIRNIIDIIIKSSNERVLVILKISLEYPSINTAIVMWFSRHFRDVVLTRPPSMGVTEYAYIVAWNKIVNDDDPFTPDIPRATLNVQRSIINFYERVQRSYMTMIGSGSHGIPLQTTLVSSLRPWRELLPLRLSAIGTYTLHVEINLHARLMELHNYRSIDEAIRSLIIDTKASQLELDRVLSDAPTASDRHGVWDQNTRAHITQMAYRWLRLEGFKTCSEYYMAHPHNSIDVTYMRNRYLEAIGNLPKRLRIPNDSNTMWESSVTDNYGYTTYFYREFTIGFNSGLTWYGSMYLYWTRNG